MAARNMDWEAERQTLLDLLEHTQTLLKSTQDSFLRDQQNHTEETRLLELRLGSQIRLLREENKDLRQELEGIQGHDAMSLKPFMIREIKSAERRGKDRETELLGAIESAKQETDTVRSHLETRLRAANEETVRLQGDLEAARQETKRVHVHCSAQVLRLKEELGFAQASNKRLSEDLKAIQGDLQTIADTEGKKLKDAQAVWQRDREEIAAQLKQAQKALNEKEKLLSELTLVKELDRRAEITPLKARNETLAIDKIALKQQLQQANSLFAKKEKHLQDQLITWKRLSEQLKNRPMGPAVLSEADMERLRAQLEGLEGFRREISQCLGKFEGIVERVSRTVGEEGSEKAGNGPESQLNAIIGRFQREKRGPEVEETAKRLIITCKAYETAISAVTAKSIESIEATNAVFLQPQQVLAVLSALQQENQALRTQQNTDTARVRSDKEMQAIEELVRTKLELDQAKKGNIACLEAIQELEELIESSQVEGEISPAVELELGRFNLEISRLTQENALLVQQKQQSELEFAQVVAQFARNCQLLEEQNASLQAEIGSERGKLEELVGSLQSKISEALSSAEEAKAVILAEIRLLRETLPEVNQLELAWTGAKEAVITALRREIEEKNGLIEGIRDVWENKLAEARAESVDLRRDIAQQALILEELRENIGKISEESRELVTNLTAITGEKDPRLMALETELTTTKANLMAKQAESEAELALLRAQVETEARNACEMEGTLMAEIAALRARVVKSRP